MMKINFFVALPEGKPMIGEKIISLKNDLGIGGVVRSHLTLRKNLPV